jgi:ferritin-like metal-binding protein YciE
MILRQERPIDPPIHFVSPIPLPAEVAGRLRRPEHGGARGRVAAGERSGKESDMAATELLLAWLKDAHAMEEALIPNLENHAKDARDHPQIEARIRQHIEETRRHAELVRGCIERLGDKPSAAKAVFGKAIGSISALGTGPFSDELVKDFLVDYAAEHLEIASYRRLIIAARELGDEATAATCEQILPDEEAMVRAIEENLPFVVRDTLHSQAAAR